MSATTEVPRPRLRERISLALMSAVYVVGGTMHFVIPQFYLRAMPPYIPWHWPMVVISGIAEIGLGLALWVPRLRKLAAYGVIALLIAVFPANVHMALHPEEFGNPIALWARLPVQILFIAWAYWHARQAA